jgi:hypothetical protein
VWAKRLSLPFKGRVGMGIRVMRSTVLSLPFKGRVGVGMGLCEPDAIGGITPIPHPTSPLKGEE